MRNTCYLNLSFFFHDFSQVASNFTFTSETSFILLLLICVLSNAMRKSLVSIGEDKLGEILFGGIRRDIQLGHFF